MSAVTGIEWTDRTWNPVRGCSRVSEGCRNCYAESIAARFSGQGQPYHGLARRSSTGEARWTGVVREVPTSLHEPLGWRTPARVFVNSMSDLFHEDISDEWIAAVFGVMAVATRHTFQVLTKRPERMLAWVRRFDSHWCHYHANTVFASGTVPGMQSWDRAYHPPRPWPLRNVWLGVSVEDDRVRDRIPVLQETPAIVRFLSCEPLIGPLMLTDRYLEVIDWVIVGGESGRAARPMDLDWVRFIRNQCEAHGIPMFLKQLGGWPDKRGGEAAVLDGEHWTEMPRAAGAAS